MELIGLTDKSDTPASDLSYGDQRLLEIGLALGTAPQLLLLDEPTAGLSAEETAIVTEKVKELSATQTIILVEHDMEVVMGLADTITVLHYGQKIAEGTPDEIRRNEEVIRVYLGGD
ncbi:MAG: ATP-binding cassette domain-containing protein [Proteobacteria bacterium]|nr:ATP-binding cassette domain-containing protein [Pseudomonadota bacterium]